MRHVRLPAAACAVLLVLSGCRQAQDPAADWLGAIEPVAGPAASGARFPHLAAAGEVVVMSWLEPATDGAHALRHSSYDGRGWQEARTVAAGADWFVNWADYPSVVPLDAQRWAAHWLHKKPGNAYSYDVVTALSRDGGATWSAPYSPHDDGTPTEHGFVTIAAFAGEPLAVWLDGRHTAGGHGHDAGADHGVGGGAMTLRSARLGADGPADGHEIDDSVCDCCQTDAALTRDALLVVYRDRTPDEIRDIQAVRYTAEGWSDPVRVHADGWRIAACPVNGPAVDARGDDVVVAWFTAPDQSRVRLAFSADGGRTFDAPIEVEPARAVGRVDVALLDDGRAVVSWLAETDGGGAAIRARPYTRRGPAGRAVDVATSAVARSSGFPQMIATRDGLLFAWTESAAEPAVRTAFARLH
jgi:hypothetical protein